jgi:HlyD family secretion protein
MVLAFIAVAASGFGAWRLFEPSCAEGKHRTAPAPMGDVTQTVSASGALSPGVLVTFARRYPERSRCCVDFNDHVKAGQILLELDPALVEAQVRQSEASLSNARAGRHAAQHQHDI